MAIPAFEFGVHLLLDLILLLYLKQGKMLVLPKCWRQYFAILYLVVESMVIHVAIAWSNIYLLLLFQMVSYGILLTIWDGRFSLINWYYALCYLLISNCIRTEIGLTSQKVLGYDILYESRPLIFAAAMIGCVLCIRLCLTGVRWFAEKHPFRVNYATFALSLFSAVPYLFVRGIEHWLPVTNEEISGFIGVALACSCALSLIIIVGSTWQVSIAEYRRQIAQIESILERQQISFALKIEAIDNVKRNYHDMKNVLLYLEKNGIDEQASQQIRRIMGDIKQYEILQKTGNDAIDFILGEKLAVCNEKNISCNPYIDGSVLNFMEPVDICVIFGNALDNAIECCERQEDPARRQINIKATKQKEMVLLLFRNSCLTPPRMDRPFFTSKEDPKNHGYGLFNIRAAVEKYGGEMSVCTDDGEFRLTILFPVPQEAWPR